MDRRSWPWKKKSSHKSEKASETGEVASLVPTNNQDNYKKPKFVQISLEQYSHLTSVEEQVRIYEEQVKSFEEQVDTYAGQIRLYEEQVLTFEEQMKKLRDQNKELSEKASAAHAEINTKDILVKQHNKVAEDAVSGWEKAEAEALALKNQLESVNLSKLTAEDKAAHLDGALKECMRQIRNLKEEHEQKLQDVLLSKTKQVDKMKSEFEAKLAEYEQELFKSAADNDALSRSLRERSNMLVKMSEEKSIAEAEIERLKAKIESCEREISSLKYEVHVASKELEIRNEERNMSVKSAEAANKHHMEGVKKIAKLEAECQRLRGLVRKKLPGPAALAQMKLEVESLGRDYGDNKLKKSPVKSSSPYKSPKAAQSSPVSDFLTENVQRVQKENELLTERLLAVEEETKMLKEALAKRNNELQASRNLCAKTTSRVQALESQLKKNASQFPPEVYSGRNFSNAPSLSSMSEDGNDDKNCAESLMSERSLKKGDKNGVAMSRADSVNQLELMDDFLEMEKLACSSNDIKADGTSITENQRSDGVSSYSEVDATPEPTHCDLIGTLGHASLNVDSSTESPQACADEQPFILLQSRILKILETVSKEVDMKCIIEDVRSIFQEVCDNLKQHKFSDSVFNKKVASVEDESSKDGDTGLSDSNKEEAQMIWSDELQAVNNLEIDATQVLSKGLNIDAKFKGQAEQTVGEASKTDDEIERETAQGVSKALETAILQIQEFVLLLDKEVGKVSEISFKGFREKVDEFWITLNKLLSKEKNLVDFVFDLSNVMVEVGGLKVTVLGGRCTEIEIQSPDCVDKVALPESSLSNNNLSEDHFGDNNSTCIEVPDDGNFISGCEENARAERITPEKFEELTREKARTARELAECLETLSGTRSQLRETERVLTELKAQLGSAQKSNNLAETQLKCMAESYRSLETHAAELEIEVGHLKGRIEVLEKELESEKTSHQEAITRCEELAERKDNELVPFAADIDVKTKQERELAAATEMLAACQQTIFILGKQIKALRPQRNGNASPQYERSQISEDLFEDELTSTNVRNPEDNDEKNFDTASSAEIQQLGTESQNGDESQKHVNTMSSSSLSCGPTSERPSRGFSRFFPPKASN